MTMTSANELAALADRLETHIEALATIPISISLLEWDKVSNDILSAAKALRATSTAGVRKALETLADAVMADIKEAKRRLDIDIPKDAPEHSVSAFLTGIAIHVGKARAALTEAPQGAHNSEWNAAVEAIIADPDAYLLRANEALDRAGVPYRFRRFNLEEVKSIRSLHRGEAQRTDGGEDR